MKDKILTLPTRQRKKMGSNKLFVGNQNELSHFLLEE